MNKDGSHCLWKHHNDCIVTNFVTMLQIHSLSVSYVTDTTPGARDNELSAMLSCNGKEKNKAG